MKLIALFALTLTLISGTAAQDSDKGMGLDPNGGRNFASDIGCGIDPNGCSGGDDLDSRGTMDPDGKGAVGDSNG